MCTAILGLGPDGTVLLAGVRDEFISRDWQPPGRYWPDRPDVIGGRDLLAGGTWLAVTPALRRVACVLNGRGRMASPSTRRSRGVLPLAAAADGKLGLADLAAFDPFRLLVAEPGRAVLLSWDGAEFAERELGPGLHMVVNSGLASDLWPVPVTGLGPGLVPGPAGVPAGAVPDTGAGGLTAEQAAAARAHEVGRIGHFLPRLRAARMPDPEPGVPVAAAWGEWLPLINGDGIRPDDQRALIVRRDLGGGRIWGTTSISLVAATVAGRTRALRFDFTAAPGDPAAWSPVPLDTR
jgi:Transport and Golgi organisation 2